MHREKALGPEIVRAETRISKRGATKGQPKAVQVRQQNIRGAKANQDTRGGGKITIHYSPITLQVLFGMQRLICAGVAAWDYIHTRDMTRFSLLLAAGQVDLILMKEVITKVLTDFLAKFVTKESEKL